MATETITRPQLLAALRQGEKDALDKLGALPTERFEEGRYENGWNGRQILAHITAIEWTYPKLIDVARNADAPAEKKPESQPPTRAAGGGINSYNDRSIERYANTSVPELLDVFRKNRATTIAAIEAADDELFLQQVKSAGGIRGPLGYVLNMIAVMHVAGHINDIVGAAG
jgi:Mycothiol maleylpyruvate isomerase N-terminal domain